MRFIVLAATMASVLSPAGLVVAYPHEVTSIDGLVHADRPVRTPGGLTFTVSQVYNKNIKQLGRGPRSLARLYRKYGVAIPAELLQVLKGVLHELGIPDRKAAPDNFGDSLLALNFKDDQDEDDRGEVIALPQLFDIEYLSPVEIGTPPQTVMLDFDTGSSDLWVFSSVTPASQRNGQLIYNISRSSTSQRLPNATWSISYGDGSNSQGIVYLDVVDVGGVTVEKQAVQVATRVSASFTRDNASSGILGLGFDSLNRVRPEKQKTFFSNAMAELDLPLFTVNLKQSSAGNYNFGFIDQTEFNGPMSYIDVNYTAGYWQFEPCGFSVGNTTIANLPYTAIADTGSTLLILPANITQAYWGQVPSATIDRASGGFVYQCGVTLPDLTLNIGTYEALIPGHLVPFSPVDTDSFDTATSCYGGIQSSDGLPFGAIYGDIFFKSQFTVFNMKDKTLGFAAKTMA